MVTEKERSPAGCDLCCESDTGLERLGDDLYPSVFERAEPIEKGGMVSYQNDLLFRCPVCSTVWLSQYWEVDTPETQWEEFGIRYQSRTPLDVEHVALIQQAQSAGERLRHNTFLA